MNEKQHCDDMTVNGLEIAFYPLWFASCICSQQTLYQPAIKVQLKWSILVRLQMDYFELNSKYLFELSSLYVLKSIPIEIHPNERIGEDREEHRTCTLIWDKRYLQ